MSMIMLPTTYSTNGGELTTQHVGDAFFLDFFGRGGVYYSKNLT